MKHTMASPSSAPHPSLKGIKYVLFPHDPRVQHWDNFFLCVLLYYSFVIPYTVGVSGGYRMYTNRGWFVFNMVLNIVYIGEILFIGMRSKAWY
mmetsp:Transcript_16645/g.30123  ORF Transcript_16645/g.30123 Transcript_16645/m.30123 type:complete len:93 (-) Transcript_16645:1848-2126(-)